eukprot:g7303.t1
MPFPGEREEQRATKRELKCFLPSFPVWTVLVLAFVLISAMATFLCVSQVVVSVPPTNHNYNQYFAKRPYEN